MALLLKHQTAAQFITRFREAYRNGETFTIDFDAANGVLTLA